MLRNRFAEKLLGKGHGLKSEDEDRKATKEHMRQQAEAAAVKHKEERDAREAEKKK